VRSECLTRRVGRLIESRLIWPALADGCIEISGRFIDEFLSTEGGTRQRYTYLAKFRAGEPFSTGRINGRRVQHPRVGASAPLPHRIAIFNSVPIQMLFRTTFRPA
jgi:hypothetical protein